MAKALILLFALEIPRPGLPQVELRSLLLRLHGLPFVQSHLFLFLFTRGLCFQFLCCKFPGRFDFLLLHLTIDYLSISGNISFISLLGHIVLESPPVALAASSTFIFGLDSSSRVSRLPVEVSLAS